jgi:hypothetical protein
MTRSIGAATMASILCSAFLVGSAAQENAYAGGNPIQEVFSKVTDADGYLTREMHERLWTSLRKALNSDANEIKKFWQIMAAKPIIASSAYNFEAALSSEHSLAKGRVILTPGYGAAKANLLSAFKGKASLPKIKKAIATWEDNIRKFAKRTARSASTNVIEAYRILEQQRNAAAGPLYRFSVLRKPAFSKPLVRRKFKTVKVTISWPGEFTTQTVRPNKSLEVGMLSNMVDPNTVVKVVHYRMGPFNKGQSKRITRKLAIGVLKEYGISKAALSPETWREQVSIIARGSGTYKGQAVTMNVRIVSSPIGKGFLSFYTIAFGKASNIDHLRQRLESAVSFGH